MKPTQKPYPYALPAAPDQWDAWEKSLQSEQAQPVHIVGSFYHENLYHESGYPPSPMEEFNADLIAFEAACERLGRRTQRLGRRVRRAERRLVRALPESLMWGVAVLVWFWVMMEFVG